MDAWLHGADAGFRAMVSLDGHGGTGGMKLWVTVVHAIKNREVGEYHGPVVPGETLEDAERYLERNGLGYCEIDMEYTGEQFIPLKHELN